MATGSGHEPVVSGAMLAAARRAPANRRLAAAPVSGFHNAGQNHGGAYCTCNGLMVAASALHEDGLVERVGIVDFDHYYGNGTAKNLAGGYQRTEDGGIGPALQTHRNTVLECAAHFAERSSDLCLF